MHFDAFYYILESLTFNEAITCRQVCRQWKGWIDQYLRTQTTLLICYDKKLLLDQLYVAAQVFELNYDGILAKTIHIPAKELSKKSFVNSVVSMFPNILHFYFCSTSLPAHISYSIKRKLFHYWRDLETLMIFFGRYKSRTALIEHVNELESLETLIVIGDPILSYESFPKNAEFLTRVKKLYLPWLNSIYNLELQSRTNITSLATRDHQDWEQYRETTDRKWFSKMEAVNLLLKFNLVFPDRSGLVPYESKERLISWVNHFKEKNYENISLLSFVDPNLHGYVFNAGKSFYNDFLKRLESFKQLRILKFDASSFNFFECILSNAQFYPQVKEVHILIKFAVLEMAEHVDRFRKAFPASMKSVEKVVLRTIKWVKMSKDIKKVLFDDHSYQVTFQKPLQYGF